MTRNSTKQVDQDKELGVQLMPNVTSVAINTSESRTKALLSGLESLVAVISPSSTASVPSSNLKIKANLENAPKVSGQAGLSHEDALPPPEGENPDDGTYSSVQEVVLLEDYLSLGMVLEDDKVKDFFFGIGRKKYSVLPCCDDEVSKHYALSGLTCTTDDKIVVLKQEYRTTTTTTKNGTQYKQIPSQTWRQVFRHQRFSVNVALVDEKVEIFCSKGYICRVIFPEEVNSSLPSKDICVKEEFIDDDAQLCSDVTIGNMRKRTAYGISNSCVPQNAEKKTKINRKESSAGQAEPAKEKFVNRLPWTKKEIRTLLRKRSKYPKELREHWNAISKAVTRVEKDGL